MLTLNRSQLEQQAPKVGGLRARDCTVPLTPGDSAGQLKQGSVLGTAENATKLPTVETKQCVAL